MNKVRIKKSWWVNWKINWICWLNNRKRVRFQLINLIKLVRVARDKRRNLLKKFQKELKMKINYNWKKMPKRNLKCWAKAKCLLILSTAITKAQNKASHKTKGNLWPNRNNNRKHRKLLIHWWQISTLLQSNWKLRLHSLSNKPMPPQHLLIKFNNLFNLLMRPKQYLQLQMVLILLVLRRSYPLLQLLWQIHKPWQMSLKQQLALQKRHQQTHKLILLSS